MRTRNILIIVGLALSVIGIVICVCSFMLFRFSASDLSTVKFVTNTYDVNGNFRDISIDGDREDIYVKTSEDGKCKVVCYEDEKEPHNVRVEGSTLAIDKIEKNHGLNIGVWTEKPVITVYMPAGEYGRLNVDSDTGDLDVPADFTFESMEVKLDTGDVNSFASVHGKTGIRTDTGDISLSGITMDALSLSTDTGRISIENVDCRTDIEIKEDTGKVYMTNVKCDNLSSKGNTGDISMSGVMVAGNINITRDTGDISFDSCDADTLSIKTSTGKVTGTLLSEKMFSTKSSTGKISVPEDGNGGKCEIHTGTGDIKIKIK